MAQGKPIDHRKLTLSQVHGIANWEVLLPEDLNSIKVEPTDVHKIAYVTTSGVYYSLISYEPVVWYPITGLDKTILSEINTKLDDLRSEVDNMEVDIDLSGIENKLDVVVDLLEGSALVSGQMLTAIGEVKTAVEDIDYSNELDEIIDLLSQLIVNPPTPSEGKEYYINAILKDVVETQEGGLSYKYVTYSHDDPESGTILGTNIPGEVLDLRSTTGINISTQVYENSYINLAFTLPEGTVLDSPVITIPALGIVDTDNVLSEYSDIDGVYVCMLEIQTPGAANLPDNEQVRIEINTRE